MTPSIAFLLISSATLATGTRAFAEPNPAPEPLRLSLAEAVERARLNSPRLDESIAAYEADLKQVRDRFDVGMAARNDVLNVQVERDRAELSRLEASNRAAVANVNLVRLLGLAPNAAITPVEPVTGPETPNEEVAGLVTRAIETRPEIAGLRSRVAAADASIRIARSATRPQATVIAGTTLGRTRTSFPSRTPGASA